MNAMRFPKCRAASSSVWTGLTGLTGLFLTQRRVTAAQAGLAFCSEPSRAERVPRDAECAEKFVFGICEQLWQLLFVNINLKFAWQKVTALEGEG
jgi:hypothetical protein